LHLKGSAGTCGTSAASELLVPVVRLRSLEGTSTSRSLVNKPSGRNNPQAVGRWKLEPGIKTVDMNVAIGKTT
jgi:hypothetical protein